MKLKRPLRGSETGADVRMVQRALNRWASGADIPEDGKYGMRTTDRMMGFQLSEKISPARGDFGQASLDKLWPYFDAYGKWRYRLYRVPPPPPPVLVEPNQGFRSLHSDLWQAYSLGRRMGLSDLGTFNPDSRLPSGGPSDHALFPARAFDLGVEPDTGFANPTGREFFEAMVGRREVGYVILGNRIWSRARAREGVRPYLSGGHLNHVHVSGNR